MLRAVGRVGVGATALSATGLGVYASSESGAGFRRELYFWRKVAPIVADYYIQTASSSPLVKYQQWQTANDSGKDIDFNVQDDAAKRREKLNQLHEKHAPEILQVMLDLKGLYIKLGQVLSVTALPVPEPYRILFRTLQSDVPGWDEFEEVIKPTLEAEFRMPLEKIFEYVEPIPAGAASIGQAHRARLLNKSRTPTSKKYNKDNNSDLEVIVKVQYPDAAWQVPADIQCVGDFLKICAWAGVVDETSAKLSYDEFSRQFLSELDYERERRNLQEIYQSSLDPTAPYMKRDVVIPRVYEELCTKKVITMSYFPGPKLEAEAKRQLAMLGIDSSKNIADIIRDAAKEAANPQEPDDEPGELVRRVTQKLDPDSNQLLRRVTKKMPTGTKIFLSAPKSPSSWKVSASKIVGHVFGVDSVLWAVRLSRWLLLRTQAAAVSAIQASPSAILPVSWESWADVHRTAAAQAERLSLTESWIDALFDVHGHQIFNLGLFNADPHPGNILVIDEEAGAPHATKLGLIDYGQCKRLTPNEQFQIARLVLSVANDESDLSVATAFRDMGIITKNDSTEFLAIFGRLLFGPLKPEHLDHSWHMRLHGLDKILYFPKELSMVHRTSLLLRGLAVSLQLNASVGDKWKHHAQEAVNRNRAK